MIIFLLQSSLCGYQIRMENLSGEWTRLLYCTTGVLLRKLQQDRHLKSLTHIIVDEVLMMSSDHKQRCSVNLIVPLKSGKK